MAKSSAGEGERVPRRVAESPMALGPGARPLGTRFPLLGPVTVHGHGVY